MTGRIEFVAVNYRGSASVGPFLDSLDAQTCGDWSAVVVDNSCDRAEVNRLRTLARGRGRVKVVVALDNLGYFGGANWHLRQQAHRPEWTVVCNVDLELATDFVANVLAGDLGQHVTAPAITALPSGVQQNPFMRSRPTVSAMLRRAAVYALPPVARLYATLATMNGRRRAGAPPGDPCDIYAPHGSIIAVHRRFFESGGTLEHPVFLYNEELTVAEQVRNLDATIRFDPAVQVTHREHQATGLARLSRTLRLQAAASRYGYRLIRGR